MRENNRHCFSHLNMERVCVEDLHVQGIQNCFLAVRWGVGRLSIITAVYISNFSAI